MAWAMVGAAGISAVGGLLGGRSAKKMQKQALALQRDQLNFQKQRYNDYKNQYGGLTDLVISEAQKGVDPNLGQVTSEANADVAQQYANAKQALDNQNQRLGINPNSGRAESSNRQMALSQALATAGNVTNARNTERKNANDTTWNRRYGVYQNGIALVTGAENAISNTMGNMANSAQQAANNQSDMANQALAGGLSLLTQSALGKFGQKNAAQTPASTAPVAPKVDSVTQGLKTTVSSGLSGLSGLYDNTSSVAPMPTQNMFNA